MTSQKVTELRKNAKFDEALELAQENLANDPDNIWNKRALAWVNYEFLKKAQLEKNLDDYIKNLKSIKLINLPASEVMLFDSCAWSIGKLLYHSKNVSPEIPEKIFKVIDTYHFSKPGDSYSFLMKSFNTHAGNWSGFVEFANWWGLNNFEQKDFQKYTLENGKKIPSLVESVFISISRQFLQRNNIAEIERFIPVIGNLCKDYKDMQYPPYYYAKLLLALGDKENFIKAFLPFLRKKQKDFWVWDLLGEGLKDEKESYRACLCKSLLCGAPDKFTINVREKMALEMIIMQKFGEARCELETIIQTRKNEGWPITEKHLKYQNHPWWKSGESVKSNMGFYSKHASMVESLLYRDMPEELLVVEHVNEARKVLYFVVSKAKSGYIYYGNFNIYPKRGDIFAVRFDMTQSPTKSNFFQVSSLVLSEKRMLEEVTKSISGNIKIKPGNSFGFVQDVFVSDQLVREYQLEHGQYIEGVAVIKYNKMKKAWGCSAINLSKTISNE